MTNKIIIIFLFFSTICFAQHDQRSIDILKNLENNFIQKKNIEGEVKYITSNVNTKGVFFIKEEKFRIKSKHLEIINNNQHNYVIYPEYKEITITKNNNSIIFFPLNKFIEFCLKNCKSKFITNTNKIDVIELYPNPNIKNKYRKIKIETKNKNISAIKLFHKNGLEEQVYFQNIKYPENIPDSIFHIQKNNYKKFEITDLR